MIQRILLLGAIALVLGVAVRLSTAPVPAIATSPRPATVAAQGDDISSPRSAQPRWQVLWTRPAPALAAMDVAEGGATITWVDLKGSVRRLNARGRTLWQTPPFPGVNRVAAAPSGTVLAYSHLNPAASTLRILSSPRPLETKVQGAIWNVAVSDQGDRAVVGTGERWVYILPLPVNVKKWNPEKLPRWRAEGIPDSLALTTQEPLALAGTWQEAGVSAWSLDGTPRWNHEEQDPARLYTVDFSADGKTAIGVSAKGPREAHARVHVWNAETGRLLWQKNLDGFHPKALTSEDGRLVAVTYVKTLSYRTGSAMQRKLALFDAQGRLLWEKGVLYFSPELVAFSAGGDRLTVTDGASTLYTLDARGGFVSKLRLPADPKTGAPARIHETTTTEDGAYLLIRRDGQISLLKSVS